MESYGKIKNSLNSFVRKWSCESIFFQKIARGIFHRIDSISDEFVSYEVPYNRKLYIITDFANKL